MINGETIHDIFLPELNVVCVSVAVADIIHPEYYEPLIISKPRQEDIQAKRQWDIRHSIFVKFANFQFAVSKQQELAQILQTSRIGNFILDNALHERIIQEITPYYGMLLSAYFSLCSDISAYRLTSKVLKKYLLRTVEVVSEGSSFRRNDLDLVMIALSEGLPDGILC